MSNLDAVAAGGKLPDFVAAFAGLAAAAANDLNAEIASDDDEHFDYKNDLKSSKWCRQTAARMLAQYKKDVSRKRADPISKIFKDMLSKAKT